MRSVDTPAAGAPLTGALPHAAIRFTHTTALSPRAPARDAPTIWVIPWMWLGITAKILHKPLQKISANHMNHKKSASKNLTPTTAERPRPP